MAGCGAPASPACCSNNRFCACKSAMTASACAMAGAAVIGVSLSILFLARQCDGGATKLKHLIAPVIPTRFPAALEYCGGILLARSAGARPNLGQDGVGSVLAGGV